MGLSGRKTKQRIGADPRNLTWANDASKFGTSYLEKFGWASGSGLGVSGEGRTSHISVYQKLDMLGIGADHKNSQDGTAWKQGKDFENLLRRLNAGAGQEEGAADILKVDGFVRPSAAASVEEGVEGADVAEAEKPRKSKKRKRAEEGGAAEDVDGIQEGRSGKKRKDRKERKARREEESTGKESKKEKKRRRQASEEDGAVSLVKKIESIGADLEAAVSTKAPLFVSRPMRAHRARHIAMKGLASQNATAIAEILGISSSTTTPSLLDSPDTSTPSTALDTPTSAPAISSGQLKMQDLSTSSKSVMDYFREKLAAKSNRTSESSTPAVVETPDDYDDRPRGGLGLGASRLRVEIADANEDDDRPIGGLGAPKFAMSMSTMTFVEASPQTTAAQEAGSEQPEAHDGEEPEPKKKSKKRKHARGKDSAASETTTSPDLDPAPSVIERHNMPSTSCEAAARERESEPEKRKKKRNKVVHGEEDVGPVEKSKKGKKKRKTERAS